MNVIIIHGTGSKKLQDESFGHALLEFQSGLFSLPLCPFFLFFFFLFCPPRISIKFSVYVDFEGRISPVTYWTEREGKVRTIENDRGDDSSVNFRCCGCLVKFNDIGIFLCSTSINGRNEFRKVGVW